MPLHFPDQHARVHGAGGAPRQAQVLHHSSRQECIPGDRHATMPCCRQECPQTTPGLAEGRRRRHFHMCVCACTSKGGINAKASVKRHAIPGFLKQKSMSIAYHCSTFKSLLRKPKPICDFCLTNLACLSACLSSVVKIIVHWKVLTFVFVDFQNEEHLVDYLVMALLALQVDQSTSHLSRSARCTQGLHLKSYR